MLDVLNSSLLIGSIILLLSIFLSKSSEKFGLPILVMFMFVGMIAGNEGLGLINYENYELTHSLSLVAMCFIIFSGGLQTNLKDAKSVMGSGVSLSSLGIFLTTGLIAVFSYYLFDISLQHSLLLGAILASTDAAAVFSLLRSKNSQIQKKVKDVIELESGSNDPMAYFLVTFLLGQNLNFSGDWPQYLLMFVMNPLIGLAGGYGLFKVYKLINDKIAFDFQGLYPILTLSFLFITFSGVSKLGGNGFLAVYVFGVMLGNAKLSHKKTSLTFFDGTSWLFQIGLFVLLGLLVFPSRLMEVAPYAIALSLFIQFVARPATVFLCLYTSSFNLREKTLISWAGLKGATSVVFASFAATSLGGEVLFIFDVVFFAVLFSALLQGSTVKFLARKLNLYYEAIIDPEFPIDMEVMEKTKNGIKEYGVDKTDFAVGKRVLDLDLPQGTLVLFIKRSGQFIIPDGTTVFEESDKVLLVTRDKEEIKECIERFQTEAIKEDEEEATVIALAKKAA